MTARFAPATLWLGFFALLGAAPLRAGAPLRITSFLTDGTVAWTNAFTAGVCTLEISTAANGPWLPACNAYTSNSAGQLTAPVANPVEFCRLRGADISGTPQGFTNLVDSYGLLETIAGTGVGQTDDVSYWQPSFEGGPAAQAALSRPHIAMADRAGNLYIADKNSHSILRVTPQGLIWTFAGSHTGGFNGDGPAPATSLELNFPNGLWARADGVVYILDTNNGRVRKVDTNGVMRTLFLANSGGSAISIGRGLWVRDDEALAYFCAGTKLQKWTPSAGVATLAGNFNELGNLFVDGGGNVVVADRGGNLVYQVTPGGLVSILAGNGTASGGGDGFPALQTGLFGVRGVWPVPNGGFFLGTHDGSQIWCMDPAGLVHLWLNGAGGRTHAGDGSFFYSPEPRISEDRSVTLDYVGNMIVVESDYGYVRRVRFLPLNP